MSATSAGMMVSTPGMARTIPTLPSSSGMTTPPYRSNEKKLSLGADDPMPAPVGFNGPWSSVNSYSFFSYTRREPESESESENGNSVLAGADPPTTPALLILRAWQDDNLPRLKRMSCAQALSLAGYLTHNEPSPWNLTYCRVSRRSAGFLSTSITSISTNPLDIANQSLAQV